MEYNISSATKKSGDTMSLPLMPKATALWLIENTSLTFKQISEFCGLHILEIESLANGDMDSKMSGFDPVASSQLTACEIKRCEADPDAALILNKIEYVGERRRLNKKYTPKAKKRDKPDAIVWLLKRYPSMPEKDICDLLGTTRTAIRAIKDKTHKSLETLTPESPVSLGLCSEAELELAVSKLSKK